MIDEALDDIMLDFPDSMFLIDDPIERKDLSDLACLPARSAFKALMRMAIFNDAQSIFAFSTASDLKVYMGTTMAVKR